jgi:RNA polymerase sigma-70 factor, ECF subfamily
MMPEDVLPLDTVFDVVEAEACDDEKTLVDRAKTEPEAFGRLYELHYGAVLNYIYRRTLDATLAEELTSNTFFNALRALPRYDNRGKFAAWLYRIASNEIKLKRRSRQKEQKGNARWHEELERVSFGSQGDVGGEIREIKMLHFARLQEAICRLPERYQTVLALRYFESLSHEEIAEVLGKKLGTVKSLLHRGLKRLRRSLAPAALPLQTPLTLNRCTKEQLP